MLLAADPADTLLLEPLLETRGTVTIALLLPGLVVVELLEALELELELCGVVVWVLVLLRLS